MRGYLNLGWLFNEMKQPDEARVYLEKALRQARLIGDELNLGIIYLNMGITFLLEGAFTKAEAYSRKAEAIMRRLSASYGLANTLENLGLIYLKQGRWHEARSHLGQALELWQILGNKFGEIHVKIYWAESELLQGHKTLAHRHFAELQQLLAAFDPNKKYYKLHALIDKLRHSLAE
jgi:tetratricopeptide (TPR) repeat protein